MSGLNRNNQCWTRWFGPCHQHPICIFYYYFFVNIRKWHGTGIIILRIHNKNLISAYIILPSCNIIPSSILCAYAVCPKCLLTMPDNPFIVHPQINLISKILRHSMPKVRPAEGSQVHTKSSILQAEPPQEFVRWVLVPLHWVSSTWWRRWWKRSVSISAASTPIPPPTPAGQPASILILRRDAGVLLHDVCDAFKS